MQLVNQTADIKVRGDKDRDVPLPLPPRTNQPERLRLSLALLALLAAVAAFWIGFAPAFVADDAYFSLVLARNLALHGKPTFSGLFLTNGFHPAWIAALGFYAWVVSLLDASLLNSPRIYVALPFAFLVWGNLNFIKVLKRLRVDTQLPVMFTTGFLSVLGVLFVEAHVSYLALSFLALVCTEDDQQSRWGPFKLGLAASFVLLARLDSVFLLPPVYLWYLQRTRSLRKLTWATLSFLVITAPYLLYNQLAFGSMFPISGWLKSTFPIIHFHGLVVNGLASTLSGCNIIFGLLPVIAAALIILYERREIGAHRALAIIPVFAAGAGLQTLFSLGYGTGWWYWYYVLPITAFALACGLLLRHWAGAPVLKRGMEFALGACLILLLVARVSRKHEGGEKYLSPPQAAMVNFVDQFHVRNSAIIVDNEPGATAFYSPDNKVVPADMLMGNKILVEEMIHSGNALRFLVDYIRQRDASDVLAVADPTGRFLAPSPSLERLIYFNPKASKEHEIIGQLDVQQPLCSLPYAPGKLLYVWKISR